MKGIKIFFFSVVSLCFCPNAFTINYYTSLSGNDTNSGTSITKAWATIDRVNIFAHNPGFTEGDTIFFEGGATFTTTNGIYLQCDISYGSAKKPIVFTSFGNDQAILKAKGCNMFSVIAPDTAFVGLGLEITKLILEGDSIPISGPANASGISVWNNSYSDLDYLHISDIEIKGFAGNGISTGCELGKGRITNVLIENITAHHNPGAKGVSPHSGSGIIVAGADSALIEHCIAYKNGINNNNSGGPVGIWLWDCTNSIIQYCESFENETSNGDGGGFDLDGGCQNCIIQYCYSHDNHGAGFLLAQFSGANDYGPLSNNVIRYNISENDGRKGNYCGIYFWGANYTDRVGENYIYNNTIYMGEPPLSGDPACVGFSGSNINGLKIWNNIFMSAYNRNLINSNYSFSTDKVLFQNNVYYTDSLFNFKIVWSSTFNSLSEWRDSSDGQEMNGNNPLGLETNPLFVDPGNGGYINNTHALSSLNAYKLKSSSPLIDSASNLLSAPFSLTDVGKSDFYGNAIPIGGAYDFGAYDTSNVIMPEFLGNDIIACQGDTVTIGIDIKYDSFLWSTGDTTQKIMVTSSGTYSLTVSEQGHINSDTIQVNFKSLPEISLSDSMNSCQGDTVIINIGNGFDSCLWSNGEETHSIQVTSSGLYEVTVSKNGCSVKDDITVTFYNLPEIDLGQDISSCMGDTITLNTGNGFDSCLWNNGDETQSIRVTSTGLYEVTVSKNGCSGKDDITVTFNNLPDIELGQDIFSCLGDTVTLNAGNGYDSCLWGNGEKTHSLRVTSSGLYEVSVNKNGCSEKDDITVTFNNLPDIELGQDISSWIGDTITLNAPSGFYSYLWSNGETTKNIEIIVSSPGIDTISVQVTDSNNCTNSDTIRISTTNSINSIKSNSEIFLFPNPTKDALFLQINRNNLSDIRISIYNKSGRQIYLNKCPSIKSNNTLKIDTTYLSEGLYFLHFKSNEEDSILKFIKAM